MTNAYKINEFSPVRTLIVIQDVDSYGVMLLLLAHLRRADVMLFTLLEKTRSGVGVYETAYASHIAVLQS